MAKHTRRALMGLLLGALVGGIAAEAVARGGGGRGGGGRGGGFGGGRGGRSGRTGWGGFRPGKYKQGTTAKEWELLKDQEDRRERIEGRRERMMEADRKAQQAAREDRLRLDDGTDSL